MVEQMRPGVWARFAPDGPHKEQHRHTFRLPAYDYSQVGAYYVTLCTQNRNCLFGKIHNGGVTLNRLGQIVQEEWQQTETIRAEITLDAFVVMPNHLHGILVITAPAVNAGENEGARRAPLHRTPRSLGAIIAGFKSAVTRRINVERDTPGACVWQRNYHERISVMTMICAVRVFTLPITPCAGRKMSTIRPIHSSMM